MLSVDPTYLTALAQRRIYPRDFLWIKARTRDAIPVPVEEAYWSDIGSVDAPVYDYASGNAITRTYAGAGQLVAIPEIPRVANLTVLDVPVRLLNIGDDIDRLVRTYDAKQAEIEIHRGLMNVDTRTLIATAMPLFKGFIDTVDLPRPAQGQKDVTVLHCKAHALEFNRSNPAKRSDEDQRLRDANDEFYASVAVVGEWEQFWGRARQESSA